MVIRNARWLALLGNHAYDLAISLNTYFNAARRLLGLPYWSLSRWIKLKVKNAVNFIGEFEKTLAADYQKLSTDGDVDVVMQSLLTMNTLKVADAAATIKAALDKTKHLP